MAMQEGQTAVPDGAQMDLDQDPATVSTDPQVWASDSDDDDATAPF